jgi:hypothetical protein
MVRPETIFQAGDIVLAEIVVLVERSDPGVQLGRQNVFAVDAPLGQVARYRGNRPGKMQGSANAGAPDSTNSCGTLLSLQYCLIAKFVAVPRAPNRKRLVNSLKPSVI